MFEAKATIRSLMTIFLSADAILSICDTHFTSGHWPAGLPEFLIILGLTVSPLFQSSIVCIAHIQPGIEIAGKPFAIRSYGYGTVIIRPVEPKASFTPIHCAMSGKKFVFVLFLVLLPAQPRTHSQATCTMCRSSAAIWFTTTLCRPGDLNLGQARVLAASTITYLFYQLRGLSIDFTGIGSGTTTRYSL